MSSSEAVRLGYCPDADDAYMFYPLTSGVVSSPQYEFETVVEPVDRLNELARRRELDISILSIHAYAHLKEHYHLLSCAGNLLVGAGGPLLVGRRKLNRDQLLNSSIVVPGPRTTAQLLLQLYVGRKLDTETASFERILDLVAQGTYDAGLVIDPGQLRFEESELTSIVDLGEWWTQEHNLPLPVGGCGILTSREDASALGELVYESVEYALNHHDEALDHAMKYAGGLDRDRLEKYVRRYVNDFSLDFGSRGRRAVQTLLNQAYEKDLLPEPVNPVFFQVD